MSDLPFNGLVIVSDAPHEHDARLDHFLGVAGIERAACRVFYLCDDFLPLDYLPRLVLCLGNAPLQWLSGDNTRTVGDWRGSIWQSRVNGFKCMCTYHPRDTVRMPEWGAVARFDFRRAKAELEVEGMDLPARHIFVAADFEEAMDWMKLARIKARPTAFDIEGTVGNMTCFSIADEACAARVIPFERAGKSVWTQDEEVRILEALKAWLEDEACPKILQNSLYDSFVLAWSYGITITNIVDDTMLKWWEQWCELEKGLAFQTSILTREPFYKHERTSLDPHVAEVYCGKDSCVTFEVNERLAELLAKDARREVHYRFNVELLPALLYMQVQGMAFDHAKAKAFVREMEQEAETLNFELAAFSGHTVNVASPKQLSRLLYETLALPKRFIKEGRSNTDRTTASTDALLSLFRHLDGKPEQRPVELVLRLRWINNQISVLRGKADPDHRVRTTFNLVGDAEGRVATYASPTMKGGFDVGAVNERFRSVFSAGEWLDWNWVAEVRLRYPEECTIAAHLEACGGSGAFDGSTRLAYGWTDIAISNAVLHESYESTGVPQFLPVKHVHALRQEFMRRYPSIERWHAHARATLEKEGMLRDAGGHTRVFFGHRRDHATFRSFLEHEPVANAVYARNMGLWWLWHDPENRTSDGDLCIRPLHLDGYALLVAFDVNVMNKEWVKLKLREWFSNVLTIAGRDWVFPIEGGMGPTWGELSEEL